MFAVTCQHPKAHAQRSKHQQAGIVFVADLLQQAGIIGCRQVLGQGLPAARLPQGAAFRAGLQVGFYQCFTFRAGNAILHQRDQIPADRAGNFGFCFSLFCLPVCFFFLHHSSYPSFCRVAFSQARVRCSTTRADASVICSFWAISWYEYPCARRYTTLRVRSSFCCSRACTRRSFWRLCSVPSNHPG